MLSRQHVYVLAVEGYAIIYRVIEKDGRDLKPL